MRHGWAFAAACGFVLTAALTPAAAGPHSTPGRLAAAPCTTSAAFSAPDWSARTLRFEATIDVACPAGVAFSAELRSANGCRLRSQTGSLLPYEMFRDAAMQSAVVSCERATQPLQGTGRTRFVVYGRIDGPVTAVGEFNDALLATVTR